MGEVVEYVMGFTEDNRMKFRIQKGAATDLTLPMCEEQLGLMVYLNAILLCVIGLLVLFWLSSKLMIPCCRIVVYVCGFIWLSIQTGRIE